MNGNLQAKINPLVPRSNRDFNDAAVKSASMKAVDSNDKEKTSFQDLLSNSNSDMTRTREAQKNGDTRGSKTDEEFARMMLDKANQGNVRKPQNDLDKDAFMKLFVTQLQNQDPLNPDDSAEMAAQLAQFHGLEQMLNVNKNLEKMHTEAATSRAVSLIDFVGKDVKLDGGKLKLAGGHVGDANFALEKDVPQATLEVRDAAGVVVGTHDLGALKSGDHKLNWDGTNKDGKKISDGVYTFSVVAKDMQGQDVPAPITSIVKVTGVDLQDSGGSFYTELGKVRIHEVASVGAQNFETQAKQADAKPQAGALAPPDNPLAIQDQAGGESATTEDHEGEHKQQANQTISSSPEKLNANNANPASPTSQPEAALPDPSLSTSPMAENKLTIPVDPRDVKTHDTMPSI